MECAIEIHTRRQKTIKNDDNDYSHWMFTGLYLQLSSIQTTFLERR